jgi:hypothetical protein
MNTGLYGFSPYQKACLLANHPILDEICVCLVNEWPFDDFSYKPIRQEQYNSQCHPTLGPMG